MVDWRAGADVEDMPRPVSDVTCALGEGPTWDADAGVVRWVDIEAGAWFEAPVTADHVDATRLILSVDGTLSAAVHAEGGGCLLARTRHLEHRDAAGDTVATWELIPPGAPRRLNDGACDPAGRFVVGSMLIDTSSGDEQLWRLEHDGTVTVLDEGLGLSNGIAWSPDGGVMYNVDTRRRVVTARDYDPATGRVGVPSVLIDMGDGLPDGLAIDRDGDLWLAVWGEAQIRRFGPDGALRGSMHTGVEHTSNCAFVGPNLDLLVVTSAGSGAAPGAVDGRLRAVRAPVTGLPTRAWRPCASASVQ
jgi:sugar lactone lactonase YvrE